MFTPDLIFAFLTLTFLEIILGIDNIIFISILASRFPEADRKKLMRVGLLLAMLMRILLLMGINWLVQMQVSLFSFSWNWISSEVSIQSIILLSGGLFLLYKSTREIYEKAEGFGENESGVSSNKLTFSRALVQIVLIDIVFSFDSILTAVGMTNGVNGALTIMVIAVIVSILIMMVFAQPINTFVNRNPTIQMLALSFLILIGFMLITEGAHLSHTEFFNKTVGAIPKGYLYFAIAFSLGVEMLNLRIRKKS